MCPIGNIQKCDKNSREVYGYFNATATSEHRIHLKSPIYGLTFENINSVKQALNTLQKI